MARISRPAAPFLPHHVIHRGNNRQVIFGDREDFRYYLTCLNWAKKHYSTSLYAYVLMTNHVHLLLEPKGLNDLGQCMKRVAGRYTRYVNRKYHRTGTLWEGRFRSSIVEGERYLLAVSRYIEMNPVRAKMVGHPREYPWSSYSSHVEAKSDGLVDFDHWYRGLGQEGLQQGKAYEAWLERSIPKGEWEIIREGIRRSGLVGGRRFKDQVAALLGRFIHNRGPGRPCTFIK